MPWIQTPVQPQKKEKKKRQPEVWLNLHLEAIPTQVYLNHGKLAFSSLPKLPADV
jgi:hypothetical protein